jgi:hypothetical protein
MTTTCPYCHAPHSNGNHSDGWCGLCQRGVYTITIPSVPAPSPRPEGSADPTHRCKVCGALWRQWGGPAVGKVYWTLVSSAAGTCCDNAPMGDQMEPITEFRRHELPSEGEQNAIEFRAPLPDGRDATREERVCVGKETAAPVRFEKPAGPPDPPHCAACGKPPRVLLPSRPWKACQCQRFVDCSPQTPCRDCARYVVSVTPIHEEA